MESVVARPEDPGLNQWIRNQSPGRLEAVRAGTELLQLRQARRATPFDGDLRHLAPHFASAFDPEHEWSASRLERYRSCGLHFFVADVLNLEPRLEPGEGIDVRQLGSIYHHIFQAAYQRPDRLPADDPDGLNAYVTALAAPILDEAPAREGFRPTAWWLQTREEIIASVVRSLQGLAGIAGKFVPIEAEARFGGGRALRVATGDGSFRLRGFIDRVDRDEAGRIRIIDYKLGGPSNFTVASVRDGKKLQLPLYALAAEEALRLGQAVDGFYWHVNSAEQSRLILAEYPGGIQAAFDTAIAHAWSAVAGVRAGDFRPVPPEGGCPAYCPAAGFCWHYSPGRWA
jgi:RecB family exonuclease